MQTGGNLNLNPVDIIGLGEGEVVGFTFSTLYRHILQLPLIMRPDLNSDFWPSSLLPPLPLSLTSTSLLSHFAFLEMVPHLFFGDAVVEQRIHR